jgi:hypothetical protein
MLLAALGIVYLSRCNETSISVI